MELKKWMALAVSSAAIVAVAGCGGGNSAPAKSGAASGAKVTGSGHRFRFFCTSSAREGCSSKVQDKEP